MRTLGLTIGWVLLAAGCRGDLTLWSTPPGSVPGARSVIFVYQPSEPPDFAFAAALLDGRPIRSTAVDVPGGGSIGEEGVAQAFYYQETLEALRLAEGLLPGTLDPRPCLLGTPIAAFQAPLGSSQWVARSPALNAREHQLILGEAACAAPDRCANLVGRILPLSTSARAIALIARSEDDAWVGTGDGLTHRVRLDSVETIESPTGWPLSGGKRLADGDVWFGGLDGNVAHGPVDGPYQQIPIPNRVGYSVADLDRTPDGRFVLALSVDTPVIDPRVGHRVAVDRLEADGWHPLHASEVLGTRDNGARILWLNDQEALFSYRDLTVLHYDGSGIQKLAVQSNVVVEVTVASLALIPGQSGPWVGGDDGRLYEFRLSDGRLGPLGVVQLLSAVTTLVPYQNGALLGGDNGLLLQYQPGSRPCAATMPARSDVELSLWMGARLLVTGGNPEFSVPNSITWVDFP